MLNHTIGKYTIEIGDDKNYTVSVSHVAKEGKSKGKTVRDVLGYHNSLPHAVKYVARQMADNVAGTSLQEWLAEHKRVLNQFEDAVKEIT